jgi:hypothetical protein
MFGGWGGEDEKKAQKAILKNVSNSTIASDSSIQHGVSIGVENNIEAILKLYDELILA